MSLTRKYVSLTALTVTLPGKDRNTQARMIINVPFSYSRYRNGTSEQLRLIRGVFSNAIDIKLFLMIFLPVSLDCNNLVSV